ncbi:hypothetical protein PRIC1_013916 [Phytophthora ramorum]
MLAYAFSRHNPNAANVPTYPRPPNTPPLVNPAVIMQPTENEYDEYDQHDGIDFRRVRAELDRLLEEGLREDDILEEEDPTTITVYQNYQTNRSSFMTKNFDASRMRRSL